jgi:hypothetical protein
MSPVELVLTVLTAAGGVGVIVAGLAAWLGKVWADRIAQSQKLIGEIDIDLRAKRIPVYAELWKATSLLPKWPRATEVSYEQLVDLSKTLRRWYYYRGGMFLSQTTHRTAYSPLQEAIATVVSEGKTGPLSDADYEAIRARCSTLRSALANDIESRREGPV